VRFEYREIEVDPLPGEIGLQTIDEPAITVRVVGPSGEGWMIPGVLDTGAAMTLLPIDYMVRLGVEKGPRFELGGGGVRFPAWLGRVDLELSRGRASHQWSARVGFTMRRTALWGRAGFLDHFTATFNGLRRSVTLRPNGTAPAPRFGD
jgi:hypothetical protein